MMRILTTLVSDLKWLVLWLTHGTFLVWPHEEGDLLGCLTMTLVQLSSQPPAAPSKTIL